MVPNCLVNCLGVGCSPPVIGSIDVRAIFFHVDAVLAVIHYVVVVYSGRVKSVPDGC